MSKCENIKVPQVRFKGFNDFWQNTNLGEFCREFQSGTFIKAAEIAKTGDYPVYGGNGIRGYTNSYTHDGLYALIGRQGALCGNVNLSHGKAFFTEHAIAVQADDLNDTIFTYYLMGTMSLGQYSAQSAQPGLAVNKLLGLPVFIGEKKEQEKIGSYFRELDQLIQQHQYKHDKLVTLKQAMLQKMFPQQDATTPKIRFKEFKGEWAEMKLGELMPITSAARVHKHEWTRSGVPFFRTSDVVSLYKGEENAKAFISLDLYEKLSDKIGRVKCGDILITGGGSIGIPFLAKSDDPLYFKDADLLWLKVPESIDSTYLYTFFASSRFREYLGSISHIGTIGHYTIEQAKMTPIAIPLQAEQKKIGTYFRQLDALISRHATQLEKLKQVKAGCLEKMFV